MKVTRLSGTRPLVTIGGLLSGSIGGGSAPSGQVPTSNGSNSVSWGSNISDIFVNGTSHVMGPIVNFANGSNTTVTVDTVGSIPSNTIRIHATGGGAVSAGSNSTHVQEISTAGASTTLWSPYDHAHAGIGQVTASSSNTLQRGTLNLRAGVGVTFSLSDTDGDGELDTLTFLASGSSGGGGSGTFTGHEDFWTPPDTAGTYDEEFAGAADSMPANWSWTTQPTGSNDFKLNSQWKRCLVINRAASDTTTFEIRRTSLTPGAIDIGFWWYMALGMGRWNNNTETIEVLFRDSSGNAGFGMKLNATSVLGIASRDRTGGVTSDVVTENANNNDTRMGIFCGVTRKTSDNTWRSYISGDGRHWEALGVTTTRSVTIDHMQATFTSGGNQGFSRYIFGPLRSRADLLLWSPR